jgi:isopenicillin N synthase-like dioxygenase
LLGAITVTATISTIPETIRNHLTSTKMVGIPVIDLSLDQDQVVEDLVKALTSIGFATLVNNGLPKGTILQKGFGASKAFFDMPTATKQKYKFQGSESNRGYIGIGSAILDVVDGNNTPEQNPMYKESLEVGKEDEPGFHNDNEWPEELKDASFRDDVLEYFNSMDALHLHIMRLIGTGLKLDDPDYLVDRCNDQHENLRLLHYPALKDASASRANLHTDYGTLTLLAQDQVGELQALTIDGTWIDVVPVENSIVMHVGEMLMRWSNDVLKATLHQVKAPPASDGSGVPERYSIAFFCNPSKDTMLECLEPCCKDQPAKYTPINAHEYITQRLSDTIKDPVKPT